MKWCGSSDPDEFTVAIHEYFERIERVNRSRLGYSKDDETICPKHGD